MQTLSLAMDSYQMKLDLLTNATAVDDDAIRFVEKYNVAKLKEDNLIEDYDLQYNKLSNASNNEMTSTNQTFQISIEEEIILRKNKIYFMYYCCYLDICPRISPLGLDSV